MRKLITIAATALALQSAWANNTYTVEVPTDDPYTRIDAGTGYGAFTDTVNFELDQPYTGLVWLLPLGLDPVARDTVVLESAMPPMITAAALAISHRLAPGLASAMVGYGILLSLATLPAWAWLLKSLPL